MNALIWARLIPPSSDTGIEISFQRLDVVGMYFVAFAPLQSSTSTLSVTRLRTQSLMNPLRYSVMSTGLFVDRMPHPIQLEPSVRKHLLPSGGLPPA